MQHYYLATIAGVRFYEHGQYGDEHPILARIGDTYYDTGDYDLPTAEQVLQHCWEPLQ